MQIFISNYYVADTDSDNLADNWWYYEWYVTVNVNEWYW